MADNSHKIIIYHNPSLRTLLVYSSYQRVALYLYWQFASSKSSAKHRLYTQEGAKPGTPQVFDGRLEVDAKDIIGLFKQHHPSKREPTMLLHLLRLPVFKVWSTLQCPNKIIDPYSRWKLRVPPLLWPAALALKHGRGSIRINTACKGRAFRTNRMFIQAVTRVEDTTLVPLSPPSNPYPVSAQFIPQTSRMTDWLAPCWHNPFQFFYFYLLSNPFGIITELFIHSSHSRALSATGINLQQERCWGDSPSHSHIHIRRRIQMISIYYLRNGVFTQFKGGMWMPKGSQQPFHISRM